MNEMKSFISLTFLTVIPLKTNLTLAAVENKQHSPMCMNRFVGMVVHNSAQLLHEVSRWHCLPFKHGRHLDVSPVSFPHSFSPLISLFQLQTSAHVLKSFILSDLIKASLSLAELTHRRRMRPFAPVQSEEETG